MQQNDAGPAVADGRGGDLGAGRIPAAGVLHDLDLRDLGVVGLRDAGDADGSG
ncbi:MAG TPA: hypothetical protein VGJ44_06170 [Kribbellaceae bacterium]